MSLRKAVVMVTVLLALGAYVYFVEFAREREEAEKKKLFTFDKEAVTAVTLTYPDRQIQLEKNGEQWRLTQPIQGRCGDGAKPRQRYRRCRSPPHPR